MKKKLYVGNLSFETTEGELRELFGPAGSVETVRIITDRDTGRSKGFGFVEMQDSFPVAVSKLLIRRDAVPHQLLQLLQFRKSAFSCARENHVLVQSNFKHRVTA